VAKLLKHASFWLTLLALCVCVFNLSGFDDKNLLLYITGPPLWFLEDYSSFIRRFVSAQLMMSLFCVVHVLFWCCVGMAIDSIVHRSIRKKLLRYLSIIAIAACVIIIVSVGFYNAQNSEKQISTILKHPDKFNQHSVQLAVVKAAKEGYVENYIAEMESILETTNEKETRGSTLYALGLIGTPESLASLMHYVQDPLDVLYVLQMNEQTIISMLNINQTRRITEAGIDAARLLGFTSFVDPLQRLSDSHPDHDIQKMAEEVMQLILQNPQHNNPKFYTD
jgi:predicted PurR-regulated permease PerM